MADKGRGYRRALSMMQNEFCIERRKRLDAEKTIYYLWEVLRTNFSTQAMQAVKSRTRIEESREEAISSDTGVLIFPWNRDNPFLEEANFIEEDEKLNPNANAVFDRIVDRDGYGDGDRDEVGAALRHLHDKTGQPHIPSCHVTLTGNRDAQDKMRRAVVEAINDLGYDYHLTITHKQE